MSPRAAARLESLGFTKVYDYVAGKADWGSAGLPLEGAAAPWVGELARSEVPTCRLDEPLRGVRERVRASAFDTCIVVNEHGVVLGRLGRHALRADDGATVEEAMTAGPGTVRPNLRGRDGGEADARAKPDRPARYPLRRHPRRPPAPGRCRGGGRLRVLADRLSHYREAQLREG
jgi:hypothetical protein